MEQTGRLEVSTSSVSGISGSWTPPNGGFLGDIPTQYLQRARRYQPAPTISHGQALFWSGPSTGMQGVTELTECERTKDEWLHEIQEESGTAQCRWTRITACMGCLHEFLVAG